MPFKTHNEYYRQHFSWSGALCQLKIFPFMSNLISLWEEMSLILKVFSRCCCLWVRIKLDCVPSFPFPAIISTNWEFFLPFLLLEGEKRNMHTYVKSKQKPTWLKKSREQKFLEWFVLYIFLLLFTLSLKNVMQAHLRLIFAVKAPHLF